MTGVPVDERASTCSSSTRISTIWHSINNQQDTIINQKNIELFFKQERESKVVQKNEPHFLVLLTSYRRQVPLLDVTWR